MNQDKNSTVTDFSKKAADEIDLVELVVQLWRGKWTVLCCAIVAILIAVAYLSVAKEKWTSQAIVTYPDSGQIANYNNAMSVLYSQNVANAPTVIDVQQRFFGRFNSAISALSEQLDNQAIPEKLTITPVVKDQPVPLKISYTSSTAGAAQKTLTTYIQQINKRIVTELDNDLKESINSKIQDLKEDLTTQEKVAKEKQQLRLQVLNQALLVAEQSNTKSTKVQQAETLSDDTLFVLGSDALSSIIKNEATRPLPLDRSYYAARQSLLAISELKSKPDSTYSIRYVMKPDLPFHRDSPKKALILILAFVLGSIIGSVIVLARNFVRNRAM